jgi:pimeloyl-ACP methyl ester carboxylesterase
VRDASAPPLPGYMLDDLIERAGSGPIGRLSADVPGLVAALWNEDRLQTLATPVDLLWGASDRIVPLTYAERLESLLPVARLQVIPSCGHVPQLECPGTFLDQLRSVLSTAPAIPATIQTERSVESGGM